MDSSEWGNKHDEIKTPPLLKFLPVLLVKLACSLLQQSVFEHLAPILSLISPTTTNYKDRLKKPKPKYVGPAFASIAWTLKQTKKDIRPWGSAKQETEYSGHIKVKPILLRTPA